MQEENYWTRALRKMLSRRQALGTAALATLGLAGTATIGSGCSLFGSNQPSTQASGAPRRGGTLRFSLGADLPHWDIHTSDSYSTAIPAQFVYSGLFKLDEKRDSHLATEFSLTGDLAESYELPQADVVVVKLRNGVRFHNLPPLNGRELTAEDVKYSMERIITPEPQYLRRALFSEIGAVEAPDKSTVKFTLQQPSVPFLYNLASPWALIAPKEIVDKDGDLKKTVVGTGPFMLDKYTRNASISLKRNTSYFVAGQPYLDGIEIKIIPDAPMALSALQNKELDFGSPSYADLEGLKKKNPDLEIIQVPGPGKMICGIRLDRPPVNDVRVRKALMYATDYQEFINVIAQGQGKQDGPLQWWLKPYALSEEGLPKTDPEKAKQLLAEAGFANGLKLQATVSTNLNGVQLAEVAQSQWAKVGVEIELKTLEWGAWVDAVWEKEDFTLYFGQDWNYEDPDRWLFPTFHSQGSQNYGGYSDPQVDAWLGEQRQTFDVQERANIIKDIQRKLLEDVAYIPLFTPITYFVRYPYVVDFNPYASYLAQFFFGGLRGWLNK